LTGKLPEDDISGKIERSWVSGLEEKKITGTLICEDKGIEKEKLRKKYRPIADVISRAQGPVVRTPVSAYQGINFNPGFFFFLLKALSRIVFPVLFSVSYHKIVDKEN